MLPQDLPRTVSSLHRQLPTERSRRHSRLGLARSSDQQGDLKLGKWSKTPGSAGRRLLSNKKLLVARTLLGAGHRY